MMCKPCMAAGDLVSQFRAVPREQFSDDYPAELAAAVTKAHGQCADPHTCSCQHRVPVL